jgi:predicted porin
MKKSLLALAVAAALPAFAYAQTNIILNGSVDVALEHVNDESNGGNGSDLRVTNGVWSGSRFAISGTEELGGGLKGIFNVEHRMSPDTGTVTGGTLFWAGQSWVGIQGGFGAIRLGRQYSPMFRALAGGDVTGYSWYNDLAGGSLAPVAAGASGAVGGWTLRLANDVSYQSPSIGGFTIHAAYAAGEDAVAPIDRKLGDTLGIAAIGAFGPINVGVGYHNVNAGDIPGAQDGKELGVSLGAKFGNFGIGLAGVQTEGFDPAADKRKAYYASLSAGIGAGTVYVTGFKDDRGFDDGFDNVGLSLTYSHGLSKRTFVYASLGYNKVENGPGVEDTKPRNIALGVRHFF